MCINYFYVVIIPKPNLCCNTLDNEPTPNYIKM